jgi:hypothetical protein
LSVPIRTWWWCAADEVGDGRAFERSRSLLAGAEIEAVVASSATTATLARRFASELGAREARLELADAGGLARLRAMGASRVLVVAAPDLVAASIERALALAPGSDAVRPPPGSLSVIDWPAPDDPTGRPSLIGVDLDWLPPPPSPQRARFPGGPGSAPSARG